MAVTLRSTDVRYPEALLRELRLRAAVLIDAIRCLEPSDDPYQRKLNRHARKWFQNGDPDLPFSFVGICDALGLDPGRIRRTLRPLLFGDEPVRRLERRMPVRDRARGAVGDRTCH